MSKQESIIKKKSFMQWVGEFYCLVLLFLPNEIIEATSLYTSTTPTQLRYEYASFFFSFLIIPAILWAFIIKKRTHAIRFDLLFIGIVIKDLIYLSVFKKYQELDYNYSFDLVLLSAWSINCIIFYNNEDNIQALERFLDNYCMLAFFSQLLRFVLRLSTDGRYGAIGLSVGGTGYLTGLFIIYCLYYREYSARVRNLIIVAAFSIILSGQRSNILFLLIFCMFFVFKKCLGKGITKDDRGKLFMLGVAVESGILLLFILTIMKELSIEIEGLQFIKRVVDATSSLINGQIENVDSVEGRMLSIDAGIEVLRDKPFGITNDFYDLQFRMLQNDYPTFPHNTLLCCYLLWSPFITVFCLFYVIKILIDLLKFKSGLLWPLLYIFIYNVITGSVFLNYPYLVINLFFVSLAKCIIIQTTSENKLKNDNDKYLIEQA